MPSSLAQRIAAARRYVGLSQQNLADAVGVSRPAVSQWENDDPGKGTSPTRENLNAISRVTGAPLAWLHNDDADVEPHWVKPQEWEAEGVREPAVTTYYQSPLERVEGEVEVELPAADIRFRFSKSPAPEHFLDTLPDPFEALAAEVKDSEIPGHVLMPRGVLDTARFALAVRRQFAFVPLLDMRVSAGDGRTDAQPEVLEWFAFRQAWLTQHNLDPKRCGLVIARGDSGEPEIRDRDLLLVDFRVDTVRDAGVYVMAIDGEYIVKQAQRNWDGSITISSANPAYTPSTVPRDRVHELTVLGVVRSQQRRR